MATTFYERQHDFDDAVYDLERFINKEDFKSAEDVLDRISVDICNHLPYSVEEWEYASKPAQANLMQLDDLDDCREALIKAGRSDLRDILDELIETLHEPEAEWVSQLKQQAFLDKALEVLSEAAGDRSCNEALVEIAFLTTSIHGVRPAALLTVENAGTVIDKASRLDSSKNSLSTIQANSTANGFLEDYCEAHHADFDASELIGDFDDL